MNTYSLTPELAKRAGAIRLRIVRMIHESGTEGHYGGSLSCVEVLTSLYFGALRHRPQEPCWKDRDRFLLSKGHAAPVLYAALAEAGYFPEEHLSAFKRLGGILQGHPDMKMTPGVEMSTGSLGQGLSVGLGMALAGRIDRKNYRVFVLLGDGELDEGSVWEAAMAASHYRLGNLVAILDRNRLQISGFTEDCLQLEPLREKWEAFGWIVRETDGHDCARILATLQEIEMRDGRDRDRPAMIIAHTVKAKGIGFLEGRAESHSCALTHEQFQQVVNDLERVC
jgi:transketolase